MTVESEGAVPGSSAQAQSEFIEYVIKRDGQSPLSFAGVRLAKASRASGLYEQGAPIEAAMYRTRGGKYITTFVKEQPTPLQNFFKTVEEIQGPGGGYSKAAVHESFEAAMSWFRPGPLTDDIRRQLGLDQPIRIE